MADHNQQGNAVLGDRREFVGFVTDTSVVGDGHPTTLANILKPGCIGAIGREVIRMPLYVQSGGGQDFRKTFSEVAVGKENAVHAARS